MAKWVLYDIALSGIMKSIEIERVKTTSMLNESTEVLCRKKALIETLE